jgi:hypothetical protein
MSVDFQPTTRRFIPESINFKNTTVKTSNPTFLFRNSRSTWKQINIFIYCLRNYTDSDMNIYHNDSKDVSPVSVLLLEFVFVECEERQIWRRNTGIFVTVVEYVPHQSWGEENVSAVFPFLRYCLLKNISMWGYRTTYFQLYFPIFFFSWLIFSMFSTVLDLSNFLGIPLVKHRIHLKSESIYPSNCGLLVVTFRTLVDGHQCFGETHCLQLQGRTMWSRRWIQAFRRNALPPSRPWRLRKHVIHKRWDPPKILHSATTQKTTIWTVTGAKLQKPIPCFSLHSILMLRIMHVPTVLGYRYMLLLNSSTAFIGKLWQFCLKLNW